MDWFNLTLLDTIQSVQIFRNGSSDDRVCEGELQIFEAQDGLVILIAPNFRFALTRELRTLKTVEGNYVLPLANPGEELTIAIQAAELEAVEVLEYCLRTTTIFTVQKKSMKTKLMGWIKKKGEAVPSGIKKGIDWATKKFKKSSDDYNENDRNELARQKIEQSRVDRTKKFAIPAVAVAGLVAAASVQSRETPNSVVHIASQASSTVESAVTGSIGLLSNTFQSSIHKAVGERTGLNAQDVAALVSFGKSTVEVAKKYVGPEDVKQIASLAGRFLASQRRD
eukprot:CAMPEP_0204900296 /NCGR_PEP_ID=MMETSP1397-20131031/2383_1 /ASSEMBLY_ACC=CAM_ASM_000891 /TAXON_ID=49980 /ORGANISM="Climacostomum Climacostomum virens, Strain Stock W-24" /LENGTH=281 /DNA_ID=CAMNT_0052068415 /DNA_START=80 /DNA_END=925 /DNA_ORIENTATION=+